MKRVYVARRSPSLTREGFPAAWRTHHALGQRSPALRHNYPRSAYLLALDPACPYDGVGMLWVREPGVLATPAAEPEIIAMMREDERRVFADNVFNAAMVVTEHVLDPPPPLDERIGTVLAFLRGNTDERWSERVEARCRAVPAIGRVVGRAEPAATFPCDALAEFWFADGAGALRAAPLIAAAMDGLGTTLVMAAEVCLAWPPELKS